MNKLIIVALAALVSVVTFAKSETNAVVTVDDPEAHSSFPICFSLAAPLQYPAMDSDVTWFRLGLLFANNAAVRGVDLGLVERSAAFSGLQLSLFGWTSGNVKGCLLSCLANEVGGNANGAFEFAPANVTWGDFSGFQVGAVDYASAFSGFQLGALLNWNAQASRGCQLGLVNADQVKFSGCAVGGVNYAYEMFGLQLGVFNLAEEYEGVQIGVINACDSLRGLQIGAVNVVSTGKAPVMVLANASF